MKGDRGGEPASFERIAPHQFLAKLNAAAAASDVEKLGVPAALAKQIVAAKEGPKHKFESLYDVAQRVSEATLNDWVIGKALPVCPDDLPLLLLPCRLETRVVKERLLIRIYPDDAHLDSHDPRLSPEEASAGQDWLETVGDDAASGSDAARDAWRALSTEFGPARAAWIARAIREYKPNDKSRTRDTGWARSPLVRLMPDRFVVYLYNHRGELARDEPLVGNLVRKQLSVVGSPNSDEMLGPDQAWVANYVAAEKAGMAVSVPLAQLKLAGSNRLSRIVACGIKRLARDQASEQLEQLLDAHHYTRGLAFLKQGTPTNNLPGAPAGFSRAEDHETAYRIELQPLPGFTQTSDVTPHNAERIGRALGLGATGDVFKHLEGAAERGDSFAGEMNAALWPATGGYFLKHILDGEVPNEAIAAVGEHARRYVRAAGPLPALRIGRQPYGLLPVSRIRASNKKVLNGWTASKLDAHAKVPLAQMHGVLERLSWRWLSRAMDPALTPRVRAGSQTPEEDLLGVLSMQPVSTSVAVRPFVDEHLVSWLLFTLRGRIFGPNSVFKGDVLGGLGSWQRTWLRMRNRLVQQVVRITGFQSEDVKRLPLVRMFGWWSTQAAPPLTGTAAEARASLQQVGAGVAAAAPASLLHQMLVHALVLEGAGGAASVVQEAAGRLADSTVIDFFNAATVADELIARVRDDPGFGRGPPRAYGVRPSLARRLLQRRAELPGGRFESLGQIDAVRMVGDDTLHDIVASFETSSPVVDFELLFRQTLDLYTHRLDAWFTSLATRRLASMRQRRPEGLHVGAYGYVEELSLEPKPLASAGFIHTPSVGQTAAAAVLHSGYLTHPAAANGARPLAINLTSARVRGALALLEGVRQGQSLGALLGYQFERDLVGAQGGALARYIDDFREGFPITAGKLTETKAGQAVEAIAARNVVDGAALARAWRAIEAGDDSDDVRAVRKKLQTLRDAMASNADRNATAVFLGRLLDSLDAVADLLTYESVYQAVQGNFDAAGAALEAASGNAVPPAVVAVETPRQGSGLEHRVAIVLEADGPAAGTSVRDLAEPALGAWFAAMLGAPAEEIACSYRVKGASPGVWSPSVSVTLAALNLSPLDLLYVASVAQSGTESELERRVRRVARGVPEAALPYDHPIQVDLSAPEGYGFGLGEAAQIARVTRELVAVSVPLKPADVADAAVAADVHHSLEDLEEVRGRAAAALISLGNLKDELVALLPDDLDQPEVAAVAELSVGERPAIDQVLESISQFGVDGALSPGSDEPELLVRAVNVRNEVVRRIDSATGLLPALNNQLEGAALDSAVDGCVAALKALFTQGFVVLPQFTPDAQQALVDSLEAHAAHPPSGSEALRTWLAQAGQVHPAIDNFEAWMMRVEAWSGGPGSLAIAQLPYVPAERWLGLADGDRGANPLPRPKDALSLVLLGAAALGADLQPPDGAGADANGDDAAEEDEAEAAPRVAGLLVHRCRDEVPSTETVTSVGFHYDAPGAQAPQCWLLAVPPERGAKPRPWSEDVLADIVSDTMDLAKMRAVDFDALARAPSPAAEAAVTTEQEVGAADAPEVGGTAGAQPPVLNRLGQFIPALFLPTDARKPGALRDELAAELKEWLR